jgi:hypothetical protein
MFEPNSRYYSLATKTFIVTDAEGETREVRYVERRFIPQEPGPTLVEHSVVQEERLDQITAKYLSDPTEFWRVADANDLLRPEELTDEIGRRIVIALPLT